MIDAVFSFQTVLQVGNPERSERRIQTAASEREREREREREGGRQREREREMEREGQSPKMSQLGATPWYRARMKRSNISPVFLLQPVNRSKPTDSDAIKAAPPQPSPDTHPGRFHLLHPMERTSITCNSVWKQTELLTVVLGDVESRKRAHLKNVLMSCITCHKGAERLLQQQVWLAHKRIFGFPAHLTALFPMSTFGRQCRDAAPAWRDADVVDAHTAARTAPPTLPSRFSESRSDWKSAHPEMSHFLYGFVGIYFIMVVGWGDLWGSLSPPQLESAGSVRLPNLPNLTWRLNKTVIDLGFHLTGKNVVDRGRNDENMSLLERKRDDLC